MNDSVLEFWLEHARPGRVGLLQLDFAPAKLINWGQKRLTRDGKPSPWVHGFMFIETRDGMPWIAESDASVPWLGIRKPVDGPQMNPVSKWSGEHVDRAIVLDPHITEEQFRIARAHAEQLTKENHFYSLVALAGTWVAVLRNDLQHHSRLHRAQGIHCTQFVRVCLQAAGADFCDDDVSLENTAPEIVYQRLEVVGEWKKG